MGNIVSSSLIWEDIKDFIYQDLNNKIITECILHTEEDDLIINNLTNIITIRNYLTYIGDVRRVVLSIPIGDYFKNVHPYRENLELSIETVYMDEDEIVRYKATLVNKNNNYVGEMSNLSTETLNLHGFLDIELELLERSLEPLRIKTVSGVYNNINQDNLLKGLISKETKNVLIDNKPSIDRIDMKPSDNKKKNQIVIDSGTRLVDLPSKLQKNMLGVYNGGLGSYIQRYNNFLTWFIFPLYKHSIMTDRVVASIYSVPFDEFPIISNSYILDSTNLKIIVNGDTNFIQDDISQINKGVGFRASDANAFMKKPIKIKQKTIEASRVNLNYEAIMLDRADNLNYAPRLPRSSTANPFNEFSKVLSNDIISVTVTWHNSNQDLIYPGMECKYYYMENGELKELTGIISLVITNTNTTQPLLKNHCTSSETKLTLLLRKTIEDY